MTASKMQLALPTAEEYRLFRGIYAETYPVRPLLNAIDAKDAEIERLSALVKKAGDLLTYGGPDMELQSDDGSDWLDQCDKWFKAANYGQPKPMPAVETTALPMTGFMHDTLHNRIVPDPDYRTAFKVGDRILSDKSLYRWWPTATVTEITAKGFKYRHDQPIQLGPRYGWYQEGESFTDDGWGLAKDQTPCTTDKTEAAK